MDLGDSLERALSDAARDEIVLKRLNGLDLGPLKYSWMDCISV